MIRKAVKSTVIFTMCLMMCIGIIFAPGAPAKAAGGTYRALLVACTDSKLAQGPYNDVMMMRLALINMGVPESNIKVISNDVNNNYDQHDADHTYNEMKKADVQGWIQSAFSGATANDTNIFFFSGHGNRPSGSGSTYGSTNVVLDRDYYPTEELATNLASVPGRHLVLLDCCNSGGITAKTAVYDEELQGAMSEEFELAVEEEQEQRGAAHRSNFFVITAASAREESLGSTLGMLTQSMAKGLGVTYQRSGNDSTHTPYYANSAKTDNSAMADQNRDRQITLSELYDHVYREATGSVPTAFPQKSNEVLFTYNRVEPAHVSNMVINSVSGDNRIDGTFEYHGPGTPSVYLSGNHILNRSGALYTNEYNGKAGLSSLGGNKYRFTAGGLDNLYNTILYPSNGTVVKYSFNVDVYNSSGSSYIYRTPFNITNSENAGVPTIIFRDTEPQPERILSGGQEYRLQVAFNYEAYLDVHIMDKHGNKVRTLANNAPTKLKFPNSSNPVNEMEFYWDGRDDNGNFVGGDGFTGRAVARNNVGTSSTIVYSKLASVKVGGTPQAIRINESNASVGTGGTTILTTSATPGDAYSGATWSSSNTNIAKVDSSGVVTGVAEGSVIITATSKENANLTAQTQVAVFKTGWQQDGSGNYFYINPNGQKAEGWTRINSNWYFFKNTIMQRGWLSDANKWYYLKSDGIMAQGWQKIGNKWYYMKGGGAMATGWQKVGSKWYYMKGSGAMTTGWQNVGGKWYYMSGGGAMVTSWQRLGGSWYYFKSSGAMATNWQSINGKWYYFQSSGKMAANTTVGGYKLGPSGAMI